MRLATLFSGIGAPEQGAMRVHDDLEMVFACEWDKFARQSFEANYDIAAEHFHKDVHDLDGTKYQGQVDVLVGGSPCQAFSIAGLRNGTEDERGQLIYQYIRVVDEVKAPVIVYENVKGMMSIGGGRTIKEFVKALREIGYYCHYEVVNTKDYGVPQNRERIFLVGFLDHDHYHRFEMAVKVSLTKRLKDVLEDDVDEKYYLSDKMLKGFMKHNENHKAKGTGFLYEPKTGDDVAVCLRANAALCPTDNTIKVIGKLDIKGDDYIKRVYGTDGICPAIPTCQGGMQEPKIKVPSATKSGYETATTGDSINLSVPNSKTRRGRVCKQVAQCLDTACNQAVVQDRIRKLTPRECLRLQDFPDTFKQVCSDSQQYKQAGNSMSVNILEMIFRQIEKAQSDEPIGTLLDFC